MGSVDRRWAMETDALMEAVEKSKNDFPTAPTGLGKLPAKSAGEFPTFPTAPNTRQIISRLRRAEIHLKTSHFLY
jgi:hypothetical protein